MPVNQPPISDDIILASWQYEITRFINELEQIIQAGRPTRGAEFPTRPELGADHYLTVATATQTVGWYKYDTVDGWISIS